MYMNKVKTNMKISNMYINMMLEFNKEDHKAYIYIYTSMTKMVDSS